MGVTLSRARAINRKLNYHLRPKNCHGCAHEWADACDKRKLHLPANKSSCRDCTRNPKSEQSRTVDRFIPVIETINSLAETLGAIEKQETEP